MALLECRGIGKRFGGEVALADVDFTLEAGEVHGLVGSNGAGKSTLMKILAGAFPDYEGSITLDSQPIVLNSPAAALNHGIAMVYQELSGIGALSVAENLFLGRQPITRWGTMNWSATYRQANEYLREMDLVLDVRRRLDQYPLVVRQMVEIARGLHSGARVLILDEPTSALSPPETRRLFALVQQLKTRGVALIFISHFIEDVLEICQRVTILRDGRRLETRAVAELDKHYVIHTMLGHELAREETGYEGQAELPPRANRAPMLQVDNLTLPGAFTDISLQVAPGECLALYGFVGAGHQEFTHAVAGAVLPASGNILVQDQRARAGDVRAAVRQGMVLVAADRARTLVSQAPIYKNLTLAHLRAAVGEWISPRHEEAVAKPLLQRVGCKPPLPRLPVRGLSGGNQQKVVLGKWLLGPIKVLLLEEPTRGMDVGAKEEVLHLVNELKKQGTAVLLATTEPEMALAHADRVMVFRRGRVQREFYDGPVDKRQLLAHA